MLVQHFLKGRGQNAKAVENLGPVNEMGDGAPGLRVARPQHEHQERDQSHQHRGGIV